MLFIIFSFLRPPGRSRKGAWIEIDHCSRYILPTAVAPVRERGLKCNKLFCNLSMYRSRSRKGAWIEILIIIAIYYKE